jgi:hypothetical protein
MMNVCFRHRDQPPKFLERFGRIVNANVVKLIHPRTPAIRACDDQDCGGLSAADIAALRFSSIQRTKQTFDQFTASRPVRFCHRWPDGGP